MLSLFLRIAQTNASDAHLIAGHLFQRTVGGVE
ncbi:Uncharacterised protein [Escherichia coli]|uniref:Uncharacterized protein n=1 Tax=Escherichia coli TaxID=562 RepID=A0A376VN59_ECOLX|nr:Uncharacterised protein [Escherichia coli]